MRSTCARDTRVAEQARPALEADDLQAAGRSAFRDAEGAHRAESTSSATAIRELPDGESEFAYEIGLLAKVSSVMEEAPDDPGTARDRQPGHRRGDRGHRAAAAIQANQSQGWRRRRLDPRRRRAWQDARLGARPLRRRRQREGSPRRPRRLAVDGRNRAVPARRVPCRPRRVLQPAREELGRALAGDFGRRWVDSPKRAGGAG